MVDHKNAFALEKKLFKLLKEHPKCKKYKLSLHEDDIYGIDIVATAKRYEGLAIELESTQGALKWPPDAPYPTIWKKGYSVPARKKKFFETYPLSLFVKVNVDMTRAFVAPLCYICSSGVAEYDNENAHHMRRNDFFIIQDPNHPATCCCPIEDLGDVIDAQFKALYEMKKINEKYTDKRPEFDNKFTQAGNKEN
jgi:hypothetical protein